MESKRWKKDDEIQEKIEGRGMEGNGGERGKRGEGYGDEEGRSGGGVGTGWMDQ